MYINNQRYTIVNEYDLFSDIDCQVYVSSNHVPGVFDFQTNPFCIGRIIETGGCNQ